MDAHQVIEACDAMREVILARRVECSGQPVPVSERQPSTATPGCTPSHVMWMLDEIERFVFSDKKKAMRWLGFVQGWLACRCWVSIDDLKAMNAPKGAA